MDYVTYSLNFAGVLITLVLVALVVGGGNFTVVVLLFGTDGCVPQTKEAWLEGTDLCRTACFSAGLRNSRFRRMT